MAWIESHQELGRHPKTRKLARLLNVSIPDAVGRLHFLWWWAMDYAEDGDLSRFEDADIADAVLWENEPRTLTQALIDAGFVDSTEDGLVIHDWDDYAGRLIQKREDNRERARKSYEKRTQSTHTEEESTRSLRADSAQSTGLPYRTVPNSTKNPPIVPPQGGAADAAAGPVVAKPARTERPAWNAPEWGIPLTELPGYKPGNHQAAADKIADACGKAGVSPLDVVHHFCPVYIERRAEFGWREPFKALSNTIDIQIAKYLRYARSPAGPNGHSPPLSGTGRRLLGVPSADDG